MLGGYLFLIFSIMIDKFPAGPVFEIITSNSHLNETIQQNPLNFITRSQCQDYGGNKLKEAFVLRKI